MTLVSSKIQLNQLKSKHWNVTLLKWPRDKKNCKVRMNLVSSPQNITKKKTTPSNRWMCHSKILMILFGENQMQVGGKTTRKAINRMRVNPKMILETSAISMKPRRRSSLPMSHPFQSINLTIMKNSEISAINKSQRVPRNYQNVQLLQKTPKN